MQTTKKKSLIQTIEGTTGSGEVINWIEDWIKTERVNGNYHKDGVPIDDLHTDFTTDNPDLKNSWDKKRLHAAIFDYVTADDELDYNPEQSSKGYSRTDRRWKKGPRGQQKEWIKIVSVND